MKYFFWIAFAVFLAASIPHVAYFFASFEPSQGPEGVWWWCVSYAIAISIDVTVYLLSWTAFQRYRRYRTPKAVWQHWLLIVMCTVFSWAVNWAYAKQFHNSGMLSSAESTAPWLTSIFPFMASAFPLLGIVYTMMAETITETELEEKREKAQQLTALTELAKQTSLPIATLRRALTSGGRFNPTHLLAIAKRTTPEPASIGATPPPTGTPQEAERADANSPITGQIVAIGSDALTSLNELDTSHQRRFASELSQLANGAGVSTPGTTPPSGLRAPQAGLQQGILSQSGGTLGEGMSTTLASVSNDGNPDKLQMTIEALKANPHITDEALAEYLSLKRPASARFWRLKAIEILSVSGRQGQEGQQQQTGKRAAVSSNPWAPPSGVGNGKHPSYP